MSLIYLASPHSHHDCMVRKQREKQVLDATIYFLEREVLVFSPIVYSSTLYPAMDHKDKLTFEFWVKLDFEIIKKCDELWVLMLEDWSLSVGVTAEMQYARGIGVPISYVAYPKFTVTKEK